MQKLNGRRRWSRKIPSNRRHDQDAEPVEVGASSFGKIDARGGLWTFHNKAILENPSLRIVKGLSPDARKAKSMSRTGVLRRLIGRPQRCAFHAAEDYQREIDNGERSDGKPFNHRFNVRLSCPITL